MNGEVFLILARADNGLIGRDNDIPWHIPADLKRFKALTMGKPMIMGRKTFESLPGLLPGRRHIVLTADRDWRVPPGVEVAHSVKQALELAGAETVAVIGGAEVYAQFLPFAGWIELTEVHDEVAGDTFAPPFGPEWRETWRENHPAEGRHPAYSFVPLVRALEAALPR